ncbi:receptor-type tyrosine-protein phosphatase kappa [Apis mellifera]|uniref:protein-tyrosine-phosphatase n=1 Tax=Apis mellifera TaxID=7460 RepID=A0A7M7GKW3_APIME|nr:receptor-type tyrosine-protein phosphatase kappa [Apis mellifera]|eukprot:XP_006558601.1 receptor-type tyrosine-protein phosphatase kappa [Apis mellifera]
MNVTSVSNGTNLLTAITLMLHNINLVANNGILPPPNIDFINETMVRASLSLKDALSSNETTLIPLGYKFVIHKIEDNISYPELKTVENYTKIFDNISTMIGYANDLEPGTTYKIFYMLHMDDNVPIAYSDSKNFTTRCIPTINFHVKIKTTSLILTKDREESLYPCPSNWYDFVFENLETGIQINKGSLIKLSYEFTNLIPYTLYKITISKGATILLFSQQVRTLHEVPSEVRNFRMTLTSSKINLQWDAPLYLNGIIEKYEVVLQVRTYLGCENLKIDPKKNITNYLSTPFTNITFSNLVPYAHYIGKIAACVPFCGPEKQIEFTTKQTDTPTAIYNNLRFQNYTLSWDAPKDCSTISGPVIAKIVVTGISKAVNNFSITIQTAEYSCYLNDALYGAEIYEARIYAIRINTERRNESRYEKLIFITPPKEPPPVKNLEIYEMDLQSMRVRLRWEKPEAPANGEIRYYVVKSCFSSCEVVTKIRPTEYCQLWDKYVCADVEHPVKEIKIYPENANVSPSNASSTALQIVWAKMKPEAPEIFIIEALEKGMVNLTWSHPWKTGGRLEKFVIRAEMISSRLKMQIPRSRKRTVYEYRVEEYRSSYSTKLHLLSSSIYEISIRAVTNTGLHGEEKIGEVSTLLAMAFEKELTMEMSDTDSTILLHIPPILNDTKNSVTNVVIKGSQIACKNYTELSPYLREKMGIKYYEIAWCAAKFPTDTFTDKTFAIGDNKIYGNATNCALKPAESYAIMIVLIDEESSVVNDQMIILEITSIRVGKVKSKRYDEIWIIPIAIFLIVGALVFYFYQRKQKRSLEKITLQDLVHLETESISSSSKQFLNAATASSDKKFLSSCENTTYNGDALCINDVNQREGGMSFVKVKDLEKYVKHAIESGLLDRQYNTLPRGQTKPWEYGKLEQNRGKNRYGNLIAYDENRVILEKLPDDPYSDYINATYIKGYKKEKFYIATQGPKANTIIDFWRMIWQEESYIICMIAKLIEDGKTKCEQYWPDIGKKKRYGDIIVFNAKHAVFADFTFRTLHVTYGDEARKIEHLHYTAWPDHGAPLFTHSVVTYLKKLLATPPGSGPVVVHCSAGVGRTGIVILCDICLRRAAAEGAVNVFSETQAIRNQRINMIDNKQQYLFAHLTLLECLFFLPTSLPYNKDLPINIIELKEQLMIQRDSLEKMTWHDEVLRLSINQTSLSKRNLVKNRFPELALANAGRVYLKRYPSTDEDSDYISAVYVDGVKLQNQYIATQLPLPETFSDFWRMIAEYKVELIIMLQLPDLKDATCCPIVPKREFKPVPYINVRTKEFSTFEYYTLEKLIIVDNSEKPATEQYVTILCSTEWKTGKNQDLPATMSLVTLWQSAQKILKEDSPIVVVCHDGVTGCGLYLALNFLLERMIIEKECDVCFAVRAIRKSRPDFITSLEHMEYLYDAIITYLKYFETYANCT